jgi:hypothetical protein
MCAKTLFTRQPKWKQLLIFIAVAILAMLVFVNKQRAPDQEIGSGEEIANVR